MFIFSKRPKIVRCAGSDAVGWNFDFLERKGAHSLWIFGRLDRRFLTEQEVKLFYVARVTRGHRFGGVSTTPIGRDLFLLVLIFG